MSVSLREHLGILVRLRERTAHGDQTQGFATAAAIVCQAHLDELVSLAGGVELPDYAEILIGPLSGKHLVPAERERGAAPVAVRAPDVALRGLGAQPSQAHGPFANGVRDREELVAPVIELQHDGVGLATVDAGMRRQVGGDLSASGVPGLGLARKSTSDVDRPVAQVVGALVGGGCTGIGVGHERDVGATGVPMPGAACGYTSSEAAA